MNWSKLVRRSLLLLFSMCLTPLDMLTLNPGVGLLALGGEKTSGYGFEAGKSGAIPNLQDPAPGGRVSLRACDGAPARRYRSVVRLMRF